MNIESMELEGLYLITPRVFADNRGWFTESYSDKKFLNLGISICFVQDNHSYSAIKGTIRGLHYQLNPMAQTKLVRCTRGAIIDVAVDIRRGSATFGKYIAVELSAENKKELLIPQGFAHGFLTLQDDVEVQYKVDQYYSPESERTIRYDDPTLSIDWGITDPILSDKDLKAVYFKDADINFDYEVR